MTGVGGRFDLNAAREEAREAKKKAKIRAVVSNVVAGLVLLCIAIGGKIGWDRWQEKCEAERLAAEKAAAEEQRRIAEKKKAEDEKRKALAAKREAERKAREEAREAEKRAREEERRRREEAQRYAKEHQAEQEELKKYLERELVSTMFSCDDHIVLAYGLEDGVELSVDEKRWGELDRLARGNDIIEFLEELRGTTVTNAFSELNYPDRDTVAKLMANLDAERFTLVVRLKDSARSRNLVLLAPSAEEGLSEPTGSRELKSGTRVIGWTVPFAYGDKMPSFLMDESTANRFTREWKANRRKLLREASKLDNRDQYVADRMERSLPDFVKSIKIEITTPPPKEEAKPAKTDSKKSTKPRPSLKGSSSNIRTLGGPRSVR